MVLSYLDFIVTSIMFHMLKLVTDLVAAQKEKNSDRLFCS